MLISTHYRHSRQQHKPEESEIDVFTTIRIIFSEARDEVELLFTRGLTVGLSRFLLIQVTMLTTVSSLRA